MIRNGVVLLLLFSLVGCAGSRKAFKPGEKLTMFYTMLEGEYTSAEQAKLDSTYLDISLVMKRIWPERNDGYWLYVEQALSAKKEKPYRQRVYQLVQKGENVFISRIFQFNDPLNFVGAHKHDSILKKLTHQLLTTKDGCDVIMNKYGSIFEGGTKGKSCPSSLKGATYATSEIVLEESVLKSWDRGFDEGNKQVWGAEKGPYIFKKLGNSAAIKFKNKIVNTQ